MNSEGAIVFMNRERELMLRILDKHGVAADETFEALDNQACYQDLYELYAFQLGVMPYGVMKARTGDPYEWITERVLWCLLT